MAAVQIQVRRAPPVAPRSIPVQMGPRVVLDVTQVERHVLRAALEEQMLRLRDEHAFYQGHGLDATGVEAELMQVTALMQRLTTAPQLVDISAPALLAPATMQNQPYTGSF